MKPQRKKRVLVLTNKVVFMAQTGATHIKYLLSACHEENILHKSVYSFFKSYEVRVIQRS